MVLWWLAVKRYCSIAGVCSCHTEPLPYTERQYGKKYVHQQAAQAQRTRPKGKSQYFSSAGKVTVSFGTVTCSSTVKLKSLPARTTKGLPLESSTALASGIDKCVGVPVVMLCKVRHHPLVPVRDAATGAHNPKGIENCGCSAGAYSLTEPFTFQSSCRGKCPFPPSTLPCRSCGSATGSIP